MFNLFERIKHCRLKLVAWSRVVFGNSKLRMEEKQRELEDLINLGCDNNLEQIYKKKGRDQQPSATGGTLFGDNAQELNGSRRGTKILKFSIKDLLKGKEKTKQMGCWMRKGYEDQEWKMCPGWLRDTLLTYSLPQTQT